MSQASDHLSLFPLGVVLFPGQPLPLHIFEERYKLMIETCLEDEFPFGVVYFDGANMRAIGCSARIEEVAKRYDDGKMDIISKGESRFQIQTLYDEKTYLEADVSYIDDVEEGDSIPVLFEQNIRQLERLAKITGSPIDLEGLRRIPPREVSFLISALDVFSTDEKQHFLELKRTAQRLLATVQALASVVKTYDVQKTSKDILSGSNKLLHRFN